MITFKEETEGGPNRLELPSPSPSTLFEHLGSLGKHETIVGGSGRGWEHFYGGIRGRNKSHRDREKGCKRMGEFVKWRTKGQR